jgi:hypothetical protein
MNASAKFKVQGSKLKVSSKRKAPREALAKDELDLGTSFEL